jgi:hypothetical protein
MYLGATPAVGVYVEEPRQRQRRRQRLQAGKPAVGEKRGGTESELRTRTGGHHENRTYQDMAARGHRGCGRGAALRCPTPSPSSAGAGFGTCRPPPQKKKKTTPQARRTEPSTLEPTTTQTERPAQTRAHEGGARVCGGVGGAASAYFLLLPSVPSSSSANRSYGWMATTTPFGSISMATGPFGPPGEVSARGTTQSAGDRWRA